jgi:hypothetical protein
MDPLIKSQLFESLLEAKREISACLTENHDALSSLKSAKNLSINSVIGYSRQITRNIRAQPLWQPNFALDPAQGHGPCLQYEELNGGYLRKYQMLHVHATGINTTTLEASSSSRDNQMKININGKSDFFVDTKKIISSIQSHFGVPSVNDGKQDMNDTSEKNNSIETVVHHSIVDSVPSTIHDPSNENQNPVPTKRARVINISFGGDSDED